MKFVIKCVLFVMAFSIIAKKVMSVYKVLPTYGLILLVVSLTSLGFEISITRYFSLIFSHHYIFLSVSIALLGIGLGGFLISRFTLKDRYIILVFALYGISIILSIILPNFVSFFLRHPAILSSAFIVPFLLSGMIIGFCFRKFYYHSGVVYCLDLLGAAIGVLISMLLLSFFNPVNVIIIYAVIVFTAVFTIKRNIFYCIMVTFSLVFLLLNLRLKVIDVPLFKVPIGTDVKVMIQLLRENRNAQIEKTYWHHTFRTDIVAYRNVQQTKGIFVDGGAPTIMFNAQKGFADLVWLTKTINYLPFLFVARDNFLSIGPGGGLDIILASLAGMKNIDAIEINPCLAKILEDYKTFNGNILYVPQLRFKIDEGRSYLSRNNKHFDLIFLSLSLTNATMRTGIPYAESYLHTVEAYEKYYHHLKETGMVALFCETYPFLLRSLLTVIKALSKTGIDICDTYKHVIIVSNFLPESPYRYLLIFCRNEINLQQAENIRHEVISRNLKVEFLPHFEENMPIKFKTVKDFNYHIEKIRRESAINVSPVYDRKPFFYDFSPTPHFSFIGLLIVTFLIALLMTFFLKKRYERLIVPNFFFLGLGFMMVETTLIQKSIFILGSPTLSLGLCLFIFLVSCSLGGLSTKASKRVKNLVFLPVILLILFFITNQCLSMAIRFSIAINIVFISIITAILGYFMGMFFPILVKLLGENNEKEVGTAYGINGATSVCGSILTMIIAQLVGYEYNFLIAASLYFVTYISLRYIASC